MLICLFREPVRFCFVTFVCAQLALLFLLLLWLFVGLIGKIAFAFVDVAMIVVSFVFCNENFLGIASFSPSCFCVMCLYSIRDGWLASWFTGWLTD